MVIVFTCFDLGAQLAIVQKLQLFEICDFDWFAIQISNVLVRKNDNSVNTTRKLQYTIAN